jgi:tRNA A-37 threonylcarbamoyl transferase component Bud32
LAVDSGTLDKKSSEELLSFCSRIAGSSKIVAICVCGNYALGFPESRAPASVLLVIRDFQPRLMNYVKAFGRRNVVVLAADEWVFERDVDRGFLGEALASGLAFPYWAMVGPEYLHDQEVKLKRRLILEMLATLALDFPQLSGEFRIRPEYFMYGTVLNRVKLFPPLIYTMSGFMQNEGRQKELRKALDGYVEALEELARENLIRFTDGCAEIPKELSERARSRKTQFVNLFKPAQKTLFMSLLGFFPSVLNLLSQNIELLGLGRGGEEARAIRRLEVPEQYVLVPAGGRFVPLADRMDIKAFGQRILCAEKEDQVSVKRLGGVLNDVYLVTATVGSEEKKAVAKSFKDWSSFKWFPLTLWFVGTKTFAVLGRSRLERECAINQTLFSKGFSVPKILHVSHGQRLVFMEYIEGEDLSRVVRRAAASKDSARIRKDLNTLRRVGKRFAKVHALGIALGDTKPENIMIGEHGEIYLMDFEQASQKGDKVWDIAEFLYYAGHDMPPLTDAHRAELTAAAFIKGYLQAGGDVETVKKAANPKYTKVFSVFTFPHLMVAISNTCRKTDTIGE